jgi:hypothetical protein
MLRLTFRWSDSRSDQTALSETLTSSNSLLSLSPMPALDRIADSSQTARRVRSANGRKILGFRELASFHAPARRRDLSVQSAQYFSCGNEVDDFVFGFECVNDGAEARLTLLGTPLTCEN